MTSRNASTRVGPFTKGLALTAVQELDVVRSTLRGGAFEIGSEVTRYPVLELKNSAIEHNIALMASASAQAGCVHAPHIKTSMSPQLVARQVAAGTWGVTTATVGHIAAVLSWDLEGLSRIFHANEVVSVAEAEFLVQQILGRLREGKPLTVYVYVDSVRGTEILAQGLESLVRAENLSSAERTDLFENLAIMIELGVANGRTGVRSTQQAVDVATSARELGLSVRGVSGYEGSVASGQTPEELDAVSAYLESLKDLATQLLAQGLIQSVDNSVVLSAGGSAYLDVVMRDLPGTLPLPDQSGGSAGSAGGSSEIQIIPVVRAGAYVIHDHGLLARANPWVRMPQDWTQNLLPQAAAIVHALVLSTPEPGLALINVGRRDVPFDIDLPTVLSHRGWRVLSVNDQHAFLRYPQDITVDPLEPGDVVQLGISHPCTIFDKWATALITNDDHRIIDIIETQF